MAIVPCLTRQAKSSNGCDGDRWDVRKPFSARYGRIMHTFDGRTDETVRFSTHVGRAEDFQLQLLERRRCTNWPS